MDRAIKKKKWTGQKIASISAIALFAFFIIYLLFFRDNQSKLYVEKNQLSIATVKQDKFQEFIPVDGVVYPRHTIYIDAVQGGIVQKVFVEDGALLDKGDSILKLKNSSMEIRYMEQETRLFQALNDLENTKISLRKNLYKREEELVNIRYQIDETKTAFNRKQKLYNDGVISDKEYEDAERNYNYNMKRLRIKKKLMQLDSLSADRRKTQINQSMNRMDENLELLHENLENMLIKAPVDGKISSFNAEIGETKSAGEHLAQIDQQKGYKLKARVDERYISRVHPGQPGEFDFDEKTYKMEIAKIYSDVNNGAFEVDFYFTDEEPKNIKRGQTIQMRLKFSSAEDATIVKRGGFFQETGGNWIYVIDPSGEFANKREIRIGRQNTLYYEVLSGLQPGEKVIISSYDSFGKKDKLVFK
ncbi:MAG: efflux RND transporter periplasmic adaptor subunit [Bacteroidales bacterium]|nr:efflux RND transporter periplasmic adaptor subunit [Bacteroidales bacterium]MCF8338590.1 efflux RND transporter periplasmic adaptor subunit [Bacteroidales bacterium]